MNSSKQQPLYTNVLNKTETDFQYYLFENTLKNKATVNIILKTFVLFHNTVIKCIR